MSKITAFLAEEIISKRKSSSTLTEVLCSCPQPTQASNIVQRIKTSNTNPRSFKCLLFNKNNILCRPQLCDALCELFTGIWGDSTRLVWNVGTTGEHGFWVHILNGGISNPYEPIVSNWSEDAKYCWKSNPGHPNLDFQFWKCGPLWLTRGYSASQWQTWGRWWGKLSYC